MIPTSPHPGTLPDESLADSVLAFARVLKDHNLAISLPATVDALRAISCVGVEDSETFRTALEATLLTRHEESFIFARLFEEFWVEGRYRSDAVTGTKPESGREAAPSVSFMSGDKFVAAEATGTESQEGEVRTVRPHVVYSAAEVLKEQDFRDIPEGEDHRMAQLISGMLAPIPRRMGVRKRPVTSGTSVDFRRMFRRNLRYGGELCELPLLQPRRRLRKIVFLCDVSGSMTPYLRFMLRFIKELQQVRTQVETFVFATRLHRITPTLAHLPFSRALGEVAHTVLDWSGGTRIGSCLRELIAYRQGSLLGASSVVIIFSDGWDRGDAALLERTMTIIQRRAYRVLWINPLLGSPAYEPTCKGMKTALPLVDCFLSGHNLNAFERLAGTLRELM